MSTNTTPRTVPTVAAMKRAAREFFTNVQSIDVGVRIDARDPDDMTEDANHWQEDNDLGDIFPVADMLKRWRKDGVPEGVVCDLYVYGDDWIGLHGNLDLIHNAAGEWFLREQFNGHMEPVR